MTLIKSIEGYLLTSLEHKVLTDFNSANKGNRYIVCIQHGTKWILPKIVVDKALLDPFWEKWKTLLQNRIDGRTSSVYSVTFNWTDSWV